MEKQPLWIILSSHYLVVEFDSCPRHHRLLLGWGLPRRYWLHGLELPETLQDWSGVLEFCREWEVPLLDLAMDVGEAQPVARQWGRWATVWAGLGSRWKQQLVRLVVEMAWAKVPWSKDVEQLCYVGMEKGGAKVAHWAPSLSLLDA
mmetsp:Transcript_5263/g.14726  ORF Transcript_5263/g.14726 Transcript_5263/m.14726 type:complete len:147 (+) Transcript_5263:54-494(+)